MKTTPILPTVTFEIKDGPDDSNNYKFFIHWIDRDTKQKRGQIFKTNLKESIQETIDNHFYDKIIKIVDNRSRVYSAKGEEVINSMKKQQEYCKIIKNIEDIK